MTTLSPHQKPVRTHAGATEPVHALKWLELTRPARPVEAATPPGPPRRPGSRLWKAGVGDVRSAGDEDGDRDGSDAEKGRPGKGKREHSAAQPEPGSGLPRARRIPHLLRRAAGPSSLAQKETLRSWKYRNGHVLEPGSPFGHSTDAPERELPPVRRTTRRVPGRAAPGAAGRWHTLLGCPSSKLGRRWGRHPHPSTPQCSHETHSVSFSKS